MKSKADRLPSCSGRTGLGFITVAIHLLIAGALCAQGAKPDGDKAAMQKRLDDMAKRTVQDQKGIPPRPPVTTLPPAPTGTPPQAPAPVAPTSPSVPAEEGQGTVALFEDDFNRTGPLSFVQHRVALLFFAPQVEIDTWRLSPELQAWGRRAVICPVNDSSMGDRAQRLAKAFGIDPAQGGILTALVRAPDGVKQVAGDQLLYQILGRYPVPQDTPALVKILQEGAAAYDAKKSQYAWDVAVTGVTIPPLPPAPTPAPTPMPSAPVNVASTPSSPAMPPEPTPPVIRKETKPVEPQRSPFETAVMRAWESKRPVVLIFPGNEPFDKAKCAEAWKSIPGVLAPEMVVLAPGSADGSMGGKPVDWEAFFDVGGQYPHAIMVLPEAEGKSDSPGVADMTYRVIARRQGPLTPDSAPMLARIWMSEDIDAVIMRAWVLHRPLVLVFPHPEHERELLDSPVLAKMEERAAVFVNSKDAVSGIRKKTAAQIEKEFATEAVERAEVVLVKLESKNKDTASVRLDQIQLTPVNRAFAKKTAEKVLEWTNSRVSAKSTGGNAKP